MSMLLITVGRFRENGGAALDRYATAVIPLIDAAGGMVLSRGLPRETVVGPGDHRPDLVAVMRFPSEDAIRRFLDSAAYREQEVHRNAAFSDVRSYIADDLTGSVE